MKVEKEGEKALVDKGFKILARDKVAAIEVLVDGKKYYSSEVVDFIVSREKVKYLVLSNSEIGFDPVEPNNRRRFEELSIIFPNHKLLLLNLRDNRLNEIEIKYPKELDIFNLFFGVGLGLLVIVGIILVKIFVF